MTWAVEQKLPSNQKLVLLMLANRCNHDTGRCDPSHKRLADECGMSQSTVKRAIAQLEEAGLLTIESKRISDVNLPNQYHLHIERVGSQRPDLRSERTDPGSQRPEGVGSQRPTNQEDLQPGIKPGREPIAPSPSSPLVEAVITLPLNNGDEFPIYAAQVQEWKELFPAVDVLQQLRSMRAWLTANKAKRKTKTGIMRFATSWLSRDQDRGGSRPASGITRSSGFSERNYTNGIKEAGNGDLTF